MNRRLLERIAWHLDQQDVAAQLIPLFCETLLWGRGKGAPWSLSVGAPVGASLTVTPVAQLAHLPVLRIDWPDRELPGVTARRAVQRALSKRHTEHLLCYCTVEQRRIAFTWARRRRDGKIELRTLPYEVGSPARTTIERLEKLAFSLQDLEGGEPPVTMLIDRLDAAFDVEAVTKAFYQEIANWYFWAQGRDDLRLPKDVVTDEDRALFFIRLLTRLIFCWFLRKKRDPRTGKGLLPDELFEPSAIPGLLVDSSPDACTYYPAILQNLFFATLNTEPDRPGEAPRRRFLDPGAGGRSEDHMVHAFWRNARLLRDPEAFARLLRPVPFLNGGLFECLDDRRPRGNSSFTEEVRIDGFSEDPRKQPKLPNDLFFGAERVVDLSGAYGDKKRRRERVRPLLEILRRYNFTLMENTPLTQEVALDPELLGHVFENLLAAFNPETGSVARKATGSFYTPRVVVDWMVDQVLLRHFNRVLARLRGIDPLEPPDRRLGRLLAWEEEVPCFTPSETEALIDAIDHLKVLDPACGSGAFPIGMLQKLVSLLRKLDPDNAGWRRRQEAALDRIESPPAREAARRAIERAFARDNDDYGRKLYLIENCLYGVDIQPIAVQIARLRCFIALIVDQAIDPDAPNRGILPLPNLETKLVAANALLGLKGGQLRLGNERVRRLEAALMAVRHDYFTARRYREKKALRIRDQQLRNELAQALESTGAFTPYDTERIVEWNPYQAQRAASFFDPAWMFGLLSPGNDGVFDIVIGNPPYVRQEQLKHLTVTDSRGETRPLKQVLRELYACYTGTADLYVYFFERAIRLLRTGGTLAFITSNKYMRAAYGAKLRAYLAYTTALRIILDFGDADVFTSIAYPAIVVAEKTRHVERVQFPSASTLERHLGSAPNVLRILAWNPAAGVTDFPAIFETQAHELPQRDLRTDGWRLERPAVLRLLERLRRTGTPLGEYVGGRFYYGIKTGFNQAFIVDRPTRDRLIAEDPASAELLKPFLRGRDVKRWRYTFADLWLIFTRRGIDIEKYPAILNYLTPFRERLTPGIPGGRKPGNYAWYEIQDTVAYWAEFEQPKIIVPAIAKNVSYASDTSALYSNDKTSILIPSSISYTLAVLNSAVSWWLTRKQFASRQGGFYEFKPMYVQQIPIPRISLDQQRTCEGLVDALIWLHGVEAGAEAGGVSLDEMKGGFERWLNGLVYELFLPEALHARKLRFFEETAGLAPPDPAVLPEGERLPRLRACFEAALGQKGRIAAMLADLRTLEAVRIIEEER